VAIKRRTVHVPIEGGYLSVTEAGTGPPLLLLHGSDSDRSAMDLLIGHLGPKWRCLAPDRRGVGDSTAPADDGDPSWDTLTDDVLVVVRWAEAKRPLVAGWSWGAKIALAYAAAGHPCADVFCIDGAAWGWDGSLHEDLYDRIQCPVRMVFAAVPSWREPPWPYTPETVADFSARHPDVLISWLPCGHDIPNQLPGELAQLLGDFARFVRSG
jgi:pimeloyl-ACP methyl ester carboxylesterase